MKVGPAGCWNATSSPTNPSATPGSKPGDLNSDFDVIILPDARPRTLHGGYLPGALYQGATAPPEFTGGIGTEGATALRDFVVQGGTLLAFNRASQYTVDRLRVPVRNVLAGLDSSRFYAPGTLLNTTVDTSHPLGFGLRSREAVWFESGPAFEISGIPTEDAVGVMRYPEKDLLASGWLHGEGYLAGQAAVLDVPIGRWTSCPVRHSSAIPRPTQRNLQDALQRPLLQDALNNLPPRQVRQTLPQITPSAGHRGKTRPLAGQA